MTRRSAVEAIAAADALPGVEAFYGGAAFAPAAARKEVPGTYLGEDIVEAADIVARTLGRRGLSPLARDQSSANRSGASRRLAMYARSSSSIAGSSPGSS